MTENPLCLSRPPTPGGGSIRTAEAGMHRPSWKMTTVLCFLMIIMVGVAPRVPDVRQGLQNDEQLWLDRAHDLLRQAGFAGLVPGYVPKYQAARWPYAHTTGHVFPFNISIKAHHPGYLPAMLVAAGMTLLLPPDPGIGEIVRVRCIQSVILVLCVVICFHLLVRKLGTSRLAALAFCLFVLTEPALLAESRLIKQDAVLTACLTMSILTFSIFLKSRERSFLWAAGALLGAACATKMVSLPFFVLSVLVLVLLAARRSEGVGALVIGRYCLVFYLVVLVFSPNVWSRPVSGFYDVVKVALASPQVTLARPDSASGLAAFLSTFKHLSMLYPLCLVAALVGLVRHPRLRNFYVLACLLIVFLLGFASGIKNPRYLLPAVPLTLYLCLPVFERLAAWSKPVAICVLVVLPCALHASNFLNFYPYNAVYTWEFAEKSDHVRLTSSILLPQIANYLESRGIRKVQVRTGAESLGYYYAGEAAAWSNWDGEWFLVSRKYYGSVPDFLEPSDKSFAFRGQEIYRLYRRRGRAQDGG